MADETPNRYGGLDPKAFEEVNKQGEESLSTIRDISTEFRKLGSDIESNYTKQTNFARSLASISASTLKEKKEIKKLEDQIADTTKEVTRLANQSTAIAERLAALAGKKTRAAEAERVALAGQLEKTIALKSTFEDMVKSARALVDESKKLDSQTKFFTNLEAAVKSLPGLGPLLSGPFTQAAQAAQAAAEKGGGKLKTYLEGSKALAKGLVDIFSLPALTSGILQVSKNTKELSNNLGVSLETSRNIVREFDKFALNSEDSRITTQKLGEAQNFLSKQLGLAVQFSEKTLKNFILLTEYIGVSTQSAARLIMLSEGLGENSRDFTNNLAESVTVAGQALGVNIPLKEAFETIGKLSATTVVNLRGSRAELGQAVAESKRLGLSLQEIQATSSKLLNFEESISSELEAELLTGRELNLERARSAALRGDETALARELRKEAGSLTQFLSLQVVQRESLAAAFGLNVEQMSEMLLKQEAIVANEKAARDLTTEQIAQAKALQKEKGIGFGEALSQIQEQRDAAKAFEDASKKLIGTFQRVFIELAPILEKIANTAASLAANPFFKGLVGMGAGVAVLASILRTTGLIPQRVLVMNPGFGGGVGGSAGTQGRHPAGTVIGGQNVGGRYTGKTPPPRGMSYGAGMGLGMAGMAAGGMMMSSENEGMQIGGAALAGAGSGAMMGTMIGGPGIGTAIGAGLGAAVGGLTAYLSKKDAEEEKNKKTQDDSYSEMIKLLRMQAEKDVDIYMDSNKVGQQIVIGGYQTNSKINHT